jgi:hypothetical protein
MLISSGIRVLLIWELHVVFKLVCELYCENVNFIVHFRLRPSTFSFWRGDLPLRSGFLHIFRWL